MTTELDRTADLEYMLTVKRKPWSRAIGIVGAVLLAVAAFIVYEGAIKWRLPTPIIVAGKDPQILVQRNQTAFMTALITAELGYDPGGRCLFLVHPDGRRTTPVWPEGTKSIRENGKYGVAVPRFGKIFAGDTLTAGGGSLSPESSALADIDLPDRCLPPSFWLFSGQFRER